MIFNNYSKVYDFLYDDKSYINEVSYLKNLFDNYNIDGNKILEIGCGTGRHGVLLSSNLNYEVLGIDSSIEMVNRAQKSYNFNAVVEDARTFNFNYNFDIILSMFHVMSYITDNKDIHSVFKNVYNNLKIGGLFIFDCWYTEGVLYQKPENRIKIIENEDYKIYRFAKPEHLADSSIIKVNYDGIILNKIDHSYETFKECHSMRYFSIPEIEMIANSNGFQILQVEEIVTKNKPSVETWAICFCLLKV